MVGTGDSSMLGLVNTQYNDSNESVLVLNINDSDIDSGQVPEGYSIPHIILTSILLSVIMFVIVFGNLLVVIAICTDKTLKTTQNWFLASLSVADFLLGLVIMPFSLANEMMGYWYFGKIWCDLWKAIDVLLCTASILSICLISLDRYWSITRAITYSRQRTPTRAALMITAVWLLSAVICVPPLIGWKNPLPVTEYPLCLLSDDIGYVLYSTMGSFYIPCVIMVFVYFKIYLAARRLARKNIKKNHNKQQIRNSFKDNEISTLPSEVHEKEFDTNHLRPEKHQLQISKEADRSSSTDTGITHGTCDYDLPKESSSYDEEVTTENCKIVISGDKIQPNESVQNETTESGAACNNKNNNEIVVTDGDGGSSKSQPRRISMKNISEKLSRKRPKRTNGNKSIKGWRAASLREHERQKRKIAKARERRATIVLGLVMAAFILCWFPFFTLYIITSFCYCVGEIVFTVVFWAGYCNSALNPIIYTVFNRDFRLAFHRIICKKMFRCR
ncbi:Alpha-2B adrenergic receptor [Mactra antiquata]